MNNPEESLHTYEKPTRLNFALNFFAILGCMLLFLLILWLAYIPNRPEPIDQEIIQQRKNNLAELRAKEQQITTSYSWINKENGTVRIPIDRAMEIVLHTLNEPDVDDHTQPTEEAVL